MQILTDVPSATTDIKKSDVSTMGIPLAIKTRLKALKIVPNEPDYSVIERLLEEHDLKTMQKVVAKRVR